MKQIITGRKPVLEALKLPRMIQKILILYGTHGKAMEDIRHQARRTGVPLTEVDKQKFRQIADESSAQGVAAILESKEYVEAEELLDRAKKSGNPLLLLVLDEIEDPQNLGALIRTAECAGFHGVILPRHHSATINETVAKTSAGASLHLPAARVANIAQTLDMLKEKGVWIIGTDEAGDKRYDEIDYEGSIAIVVGNEGKGIRRLVKEKCDFLVRIPVFGTVRSLNASVAGGLVMYEAARKRKHP
ncbi:MAG: 23S rRNA (guanosine(2251)-2'-O)-methyltransferase RlmB [Ignavibacteriales bacterium]|nr:23S rRNA (guanosine(2251)-2'-O)-methyltransferase RlmB [Ignavibacteriales bacterium]